MAFPSHTPLGISFRGAPYLRDQAAAQNKRKIMILMIFSITYIIMNTEWMMIMMSPPPFLLLYVAPSWYSRMRYCFSKCSAKALQTHRVSRLDGCVASPRALAKARLLITPVYPSIPKLSPNCPLTVSNLSPPKSRVLSQCRHHSCTVVSF